MTTTKTDADITTDVEDELAWDPAVTITDLNVSTSNGHVTLSGTADSYGTWYGAGAAARRVNGVHDVTNNIKLDLSAISRSDADIAADVRSVLYLDSDVPLDRITVEGHDGIVTLRGTVKYYHQREAAMDDAGSIAGVSGLVDLITVQSPFELEEDISDRIASAFARNSQLADDNVTVRVDGKTATLSGTVRTWGEYYEAENATWRAPGITNVQNNIRVTY